MRTQIMIFLLIALLCFSAETEASGTALKKMCGRKLMAFKNIVCPGDCTEELPEDFAFAACAVGTSDILVKQACCPGK